MQISNKIYCDDIFLDIEVENKLLPNPYLDYPYLVIKNFLPKSICDEMVRFTKIKDDDFSDAKVKVEVESGVVQPKLKKEYRKTNIYTLDETFEAIYEKQFKKYQSKIEEYFSTALTLSTPVQVLEYTEGCFYIKHADDSSELLDSEGNTVGFLCVALERKITTVLFVSSFDESLKNEFTFSGGELLFNYLKDESGKTIKLEPKAGDMVVFPSNPYFSHEVLKVKEGYRLTLVQWHDGII